MDGVDLERPELGPAAAPDPALHSLGEAVEGVA
jgi:hypothetical protein